MEKLMRVYNASWYSTTADGRNGEWVDYTFRPLSGNFSESRHLKGAVGDYVVGKKYRVDVDEQEPVILISHPEITNVIEAVD